MQLAEIDKAVSDQAILGSSDGLWHAMNRGHFGQNAGFGNLGVNPDFHQVIGHGPAQRLECRVVVHRHAVAGAGQFDCKFGAQPPFGGQGQDAVGQQDRFVHVVGDQDAGLFIGL